MNAYDDFFIPDSNQSPQAPEYDDFFIPDKKKGKAEKTGRVALQFGLGAAENALLPYDIAVAPLASKEAQHGEYRKHIFEDIERLQEQKQMGQWGEQDQSLYNSLLDQIQNPEKAEEFVKTADIGVRGLAEKATGMDLRPEGYAEKIAHWSGFLKKPQNILNFGKDLAKLKITSKEFASFFGKDSLRAIGTGTGLQMAENYDLGPMGTIALALGGDLSGAGVEGAIKGGIKAIASPKETAARIASVFTPKNKQEIQKQIIQDFRDSGITLDLGTMTDNKLIKLIQAKLSSSGLTGKALDDLRQQITNDIKEEYRLVAEGLGEAKYHTLFEAGEAGKEAIIKARDADKLRHASLYDASRRALQEGASVRTTRLGFSVDELLNKLAPGSLKSTEQKTVVSALEKLQEDLKGEFVGVEDLINNKTALSDIINYEVQGGQKQLLKKIVVDLDKAIISHGAENKKFGVYYKKANEEFAKHAKVFRNKNIDKIITDQNPETLMRKMDTVQGIRNIKRILSETPEGTELFNSLKRFKLDQMIGNKMTDNVSEQLKLGTFSNLLKRPKDKQLVLELLGAKAFQRLERLQKNAGKLAQTASKFLNPSQTASTAIDVSLISKGLSDMSHALSGNFWPLIKSVGGLSSANYLSRLMADPEFLKMVEEAILASGKNDTKLLMKIGEQMEPTIRAAISKSLQADNSQ